MERVQYFYIDESPVLAKHWLVKFDPSKVNMGPTIGSYNLMAARLFNISYVNYLRMCRDLFNAVIYGKNTYYPVAYFPDKLLAEQLCNSLNVRMAALMFDREHPDFQEHLEYLSEYDKSMAESIGE